MDIDMTTGNYVMKDKEYKNSDTKLGIILLAGYNMEVAGKDAFVEANYDMIDNFNTLGVKAGLYFDLK